MWSIKVNQAWMPRQKFFFPLPIHKFVFIYSKDRKKRENSSSETNSDSSVGAAGNNYQCE